MTCEEAYTNGDAMAFQPATDLRDAEVTDRSEMEVESKEGVAMARKNESGEQKWRSLYRKWRASRAMKKWDRRLESIEETLRVKNKLSMRRQEDILKIVTSCYSIDIKIPKKFSPQLSKLPENAEVKLGIPRVSALDLYRVKVVSSGKRVKGRLSSSLPQQREAVPKDISVKNLNAMSNNRIASIGLAMAY